MPINDELEEDQNQKDSDKKEGKSKVNKGNLLVILTGVLVITITPISTWLVVRNFGPDTAASTEETPEKKKGEEKSPENSKEVLFPIDPLVVNIAETRMTRVLSVQMHLVLSDEKLKTVLEDKMPMVKDRIMSIVGRKTLSELEDESGRKKLKRDIALEINEMTRDEMAGTVLNVVFSQFLIQ